MYVTQCNQRALVTVIIRCEISVRLRGRGLWVSVCVKKPFSHRDHATKTLLYDDARLFFYIESKEGKKTC